jgi:4-hydroxy-3-polyprenylbenzoate decarboxylase
MNDFLWAMCTRVDPTVDTDFIRRAWSGPLDPVIPKNQKGFSTPRHYRRDQTLRVGDFPMDPTQSDRIKNRWSQKFGKHL